jgi:predicted nuclease of restriction endonuclease-like RecB superfamily
MLTGSLVRVRYSRQRILPVYVSATDPANFELATRLLDAFRNREGVTRGELMDDLVETFGDRPGLFLQQGLTKLLEDRCEFAVVSGQPPETLREAVFGSAAAARGGGSFDRAAVLQSVSSDLGQTPADVEAGLFADLKSEQQLVKFQDTTSERLLQRYNVALAQAVLLRAVGVTIDIRREPPARLRRLFRLVKFHRLVCDVESLGPDAYRLKLDGPMSLFTATQKYGLQLALFLPAVLHCRDFTLTAELRWGPQRKPKTFTLSPADGLVSPQPEQGTYVPPELAMFAEQFRKKAAGWLLHDETAVFPLGGGFWVPDFRLEHVESGRALYLEVLGFWRRSSAEAHLRRLKEHARKPYILAVSEQLKIDDVQLEGLPAEVVRFKAMPLPEEVVKRAEKVTSRQ